MCIEEVIRITIRKFFDEYWDEKDFLTEDDVRARLYGFLYQELQNHENASVHCEVRWYGNREDQLKYRSDIVILDKDDLRIDGSTLRLPSKAYGFNKYYSIIEIKLRRSNNRDSDIKYNQIIRSDIKKLIEIKDQVYEVNANYFVIAFDKKKKRKILLDIDTFNINHTINWENMEYLR